MNIFYIPEGSAYILKNIFKIKSSLKVEWPINKNNKKSIISIN